MSESFRHKILLEKTWQIRLPSHTEYRLVPYTPQYLAGFQEHCMDPENNPIGIPLTIWDENRIASFRERTTLRYQSQDPDCLQLLLLNKDDRVVGNGGLYGWSLEKGKAVAGIILSPCARGKGLGYEIMSILIQVGFDSGLSTIEVGTMLGNHAMRNVMRKLGGTEMRNRVEIEGRGIVAEVECTFGRETWQKVPYRLETVN